MSAGSTASNLHLPSGISLSALGKTLIFIGLLIGLLLTRLDSFLLFHSLAEIFGIIVAFAVFIVAWNSHGLVKNNYLLILGVGSLFIGLIETIHTIGYEGMGLLTSYGATLSSQLWIAARLMQAVTLFVAPFFIHRKLSKNTTMLVYAAVTAFLFASIFAWKNFPITYVEGLGLTAFKVISEYVVIAILLGAAGLLLHHRSDFDLAVLRLLLGSVVALILGEFAFTLYIGLQDPVSVAGHLLYITGFFLLYLAVVETGFTKPYSLLFHQMKQESDALLDRERSLADLQARELDAIFSSMTDGVALYAPDGRIVRTNEAADRFYELMGVSPRSPIDRRVRSLSFLWEDGTPVEKAGELPVQRALKGETVHNVVLGVPIEATGEICWLANGAAPVHDPAGGIRGAVLTFRDISKRKVAEEEIQRLNQELERRVIDRTAQMQASRAAWLYARSLIEASLDPLVTIGPNGKITDVNHATEVITGVERKLLIGNDFIDYFTDPDKARTGYEKVLLDGLVRDYPLTVRHVSGKTTNVLYNATLYRNEAGEVQGIFAAARDMTDLEQSEQARRSAALYARSLLEAALDPLVTISPEGKITDVNQATELITGVKRRQLIGKDFADYFTEPARARQGYQRVLSEGLVRDYPLTIRHISGKATDVLYNATLYRNEAGEMQGVFAAARDITELKRAEAEIHELNQSLEARVAEGAAQLEEANRDLDSFAYSVSHDLRAPLRHIDGFIELLQQELGNDLDEKARHHMTLIAQSAGQLGRLVDDLLEFSRLGRAEMTRTEIDLDELIREVISDFRAETDERKVEWRIGPLPCVTGDRSMLQIVLANLISNALKFTRPCQAAVIEIGSAPSDSADSVVFIRDNGVGFDMEHAEMIFGVFQRLHRAEDFEGTGIGLASVRRIISRHGGRTWAEGEPDAGATFYFALPVRSAGHKSHA